MASVRLSMASVAKRKAGVEAFSYDRPRLAPGIVPPGARCVRARSPRRIHQGRPRARLRRLLVCLGHRRRQSAATQPARPAAPAGSPLHADRTLRRRRQGARHRLPQRRAGGGRTRRWSWRRWATRVQNRQSNHHQGLLPRSSDRTIAGVASRHPARSRNTGVAAYRDQIDSCGARCAAQSRPARALYGAVLR